MSLAVGSPVASLHVKGSGWYVEGKATEAGSSWGAWERLFVSDEEGLRWASSSRGIARTRRI